MSSTLATPASTAGETRYKVLGAISLSHFLNDLLQSLIVAIYPLLKGNYDLNFTQIGLLTLTYQITASLLQPVVGYWTDKYPMPWSLPIGMCFTLSGLVLLAMAGSFHMVLLAAALALRARIGASAQAPAPSSKYSTRAEARARLAGSGGRVVAMSIRVWPASAPSPPVVSACSCKGGSDMKPSSSSP